jgi:hypothetical protein
MDTDAFLHPEPPMKLVDREIESWERTYATFLHLTLLGYLVASFLMIIAPIVMWLIKKDESEFIDDHGRETVNFHISLVIYSLLSAIVAVPLGFVTCGIGFLIMLVPYILGVIGMIQASMAAGRGEYYRYPMNIRFIHPPLGA